jgi:putative DNA primase/helicase
MAEANNLNNADEAGSIELNFDTLHDVAPMLTPHEAKLVKYGIDEFPKSYGEQYGYISHESVLNAITMLCSALDFNELAHLEEGQNVTIKQQQIIVVEQVLKLAMENKLSLCKKNGAVYVFNGAYWKQIEKEELEHFLGVAAQKFGVSEFTAKHYTFKQELVKQFLSSAYLREVSSIKGEVKINLLNGTFVITPDGNYMKPFDRNDFLTHQLPFAFDANADCPIFDAYLNRVLPDVEQQNVLAEYFGYSFVPTSTLKLEKAIILIGSGANGKSILFDLANSLFGKENISNYSLASLTSKEGYYRARLADKLLNYASEISPSMDSTYFKQLVSGEPIEARLPHGAPFVLRDYSKFIFNTNNLPRDVEHNEAFYRRLLVIKFGVTIPVEERDPNLAQKIIATDLPGIFNWVLDGLKRLLLNQGFTYSASINSAVSDYRQQSDTVFLYMDEKGYEVGEDEKADAYQIHHDYQEYCKSSGYKPCARKTFNERLRNLGYNIVRHKTGMVLKYSKIKI